MTIREEALAVLDTSSKLFLPEDENLRETGNWGQFTLWQQGKTHTFQHISTIFSVTHCHHGDTRVSVCLSNK